MLYRISFAERGLTGIASIFRSLLSGLDDLLRAGTVPLNLVTRIKLGCHIWCEKHALRLHVGGPKARVVQALSHITKALNQKQNNITQNHKILFFQIIKTQKSA